MQVAEFSAYRLPVPIPETTADPDAARTEKVTAALKAIDQGEKALVDSPFLTHTRHALISGRDSAQIVTGEVLRFWKPSALIMVGIAFGRDSQRQRIGDVLISERIIAYEPERVGSESTISRGQQFLPGFGYSIHSEMPIWTGLSAIRTGCLAPYISARYSRVKN